MVGAVVMAVAVVGVVDRAAAMVGAVVAVHVRVSSVSKSRVTCVARVRRTMPHCADDG